MKDTGDREVIQGETKRGGTEGEMEKGDRCSRKESMDKGRGNEERRQRGGDGGWETDVGDRELGDTEREDGERRQRGGD